MSSHPVYEIVTYGLAPGVSPDDFRAMAARMDPVIRAYPGLVAREVLHDEERGAWVELCRWASLREAQDAARAALEDPALAPYFAMMDMASLDMRHLAIVPLAAPLPA